MFFQRYLMLCEKTNEKPYSVSKKLGLGNSNVAQWKKGSTPRPEVLSKIANYFGVSVEYLLTGEEQQKKPPLQEGELSEAKKEVWEAIQTWDDEKVRRFMRIAKAIDMEDK